MSINNEVEWEIEISWNRQILALNKRNHEQSKLQDENQHKNPKEFHKST